MALFDLRVASYGRFNYGFYVELNFEYDSETYQYCLTKDVMNVPLKPGAFWVWNEEIGNWAVPDLPDGSREIFSKVIESHRVMLIVEGIRQFYEN
jgi:hypothetical protein